MSNQNIDWGNAIKPLLKKYKDTKHPLSYESVYQLVIMVILSAQDSDKHINQIAPTFFKVFPNMATLSKATEDTLTPLISGVRNFANKVQWLLKMSNEIKADKNIPLTMDALVALPGIGRKSANVILREAGEKPEGVIVDLHVVRVAPRLGISNAANPVKIEKDIMNILPQSQWDAGMAISFLGRETCRPTNPKCTECVMNTVCEFYKSNS